MEVVKEHSSRARTPLVLLAGLASLPACGRAHARAPLQIERLYEGELDRPILGIALAGGGIEILVRTRDPLTTSLPLVGVPRELTLVFADRWSRYLRLQLDDTLPAPDLEQVPALVPDGWSLSLGASATLAWSTAEPGGNAPRAWIHMGGASSPIVLPTSRARWGSVDEAGEHAAVGLLDSTILVDERGAEKLRLPAAASGRLSPDGAWLALVHERGCPRTLELVRTADGLGHELASEPLLALAFDAAGTKLALVSRGTVRVLELGSGPAKELLSLPAPAGQEWRSAAFGPNGQLALGGLRDVRRARRQGLDPAQLPVTASARVVLEVLSPAFQPVGDAHIDVKRWNSRSPELAFGADGQLYAIVWPSGFRVVLP